MKEKKKTDYAVDVLLVYIFPLIAIILLIVKNYVFEIKPMSFIEMTFNSISIFASTNASVVSSMYIIKKMENFESTISKRFLFFILSFAMYFILELIESKINNSFSYIIVAIVLLLLSGFITYMIIKDFCETNKYINRNISILDEETNEKYNNVKDEEITKMKNEDYNVKG